jgi:hypothetical protein
MKEEKGEIKIKKEEQSNKSRRYKKMVIYLEKGQIKEERKKVLEGYILA